MTVYHILFLFSTLMRQFWDTILLKFVRPKQNQPEIFPLKTSKMIPFRVRIHQKRLPLYPMGVHRAYISLKCQKSTPVQSPVLKKVKILKIHLTYTEKYAIIATGASPYPVVQLFFGSTNWFNCFVPIHQVQNERRTKKPYNKRYRSKTKDIRC